MDRSRSPLWLTLSTAAALAILLWLGFWQLERREEKLAHIAQLNERLTAPPLSLDHPANLDAGEIDALMWRRILLRGHFGAQTPLRLYALAPDGTPGHRHILPFYLEPDGTAVLVDWGFVPQSQADRQLAVPEPSQDTSVIETILRPEMPPAHFAPADQPDENLFYSRSYSVMYAHARLPVVSKARPLLFELISPLPAQGQIPRPLPFEVDLHNPHLGYALTWFALACVLAVIYLVKLSQLRRRARLAGQRSAL
jgi:surfeit locus 1 family protein